MIDFTNCKEEINTYKGSEKKKTLIYENKKYLVKFPDPIREKNKDISYINNAYSEYIGSHIFEIIGLKTQKTLLGKYKYDNKEKVVCACLDFTDDNNFLLEFENLALSINVDKKIDTELSDIMGILESSRNLIDYDKTKELFFDMFIVDALIGNTDRYNKDWGFLVNKNTKKTTLAPIFDCGSCLNPLLEDKEIITFKESDIKNLAVNNYSCFKENGKKINYLSYIKEMQNEDCNKALLRLFKRIKIDEILEFIDKIELSDIRKNFYKTILEYRYNILKEVYEKLGG